MDSQLNTVNSDAGDESTTATNYQKFEEVYIKQEPLEENYQDQDCESDENELQNKVECVLDNDKQNDKECEDPTLFPITGETSKDCGSYGKVLQDDMQWLESLPVVLATGNDADNENRLKNQPEVTVSANNLIENAPEIADLYTKEGNLRKRKKYNVNLETRKRMKLNKIKEDHKPLPPCDPKKCKKKCTNKISQLRRCEINKQFWDLSWSERRTFIFNTCKRSAVKRRPKSAGSERKQNTFKYLLPAENLITDAVSHEVCKVFFLTTLGYKKQNDRVITEVLSKTENGSSQPSGDTRGKHKKHNKFQHEDLLIQHIESFNPTISYYQREHAKDTRYLPSDVNISMMFKDFQEKYPNLKLSYELYRQKVKSLRIQLSQPNKSIG